MLAHDDFVGGERDQRAAGHGVVGHKHRNLGLVLTDRLGDLQRRQYQTPRSVEDEVERYLGIRQLNGAQNLFGIIDVDVARDGKSEEPHGLLPMHQQDHPRFSLAFEFRDLAQPHGLKHLLLQHRLDRREYEEKPDQITERHETLLWHDISYSPLGVEAEHAFVRVVHAVAPLGPDQERAKCEPSDKPSDMGPPRHVSAGSRQQEGYHRLQNLNQKPEADKDKRVDFEKQRDEQDRDDHDHLRHRKQPHVAAENAGDCAGGA